MKHLLFFTLVAIECCYRSSAEFFGTSVAVGILGSVIYSSFHTIQCQISECCQPNSDWIKPNFTKLSKDLTDRVHGQHLVQEVVIRALRSHYVDFNPKKALVISLHGDTGTGKNFVSDIIADALYRNGGKSAYVSKFIASVDFPHDSQSDIYKLNLVDKIRAQVALCPRSLFIFDEVHKLPSGLIDSIKPFIDHHKDVQGIDFRKTVFIFLSNTGTKKIGEFVLKWWGEGRTRADITLKDIEHLVQNGAFNEKGGLHMSELIQHSLVDYYVPFLPLERRHVEMCARDDLIARRKYPDANIIRQVGDDHFYSPSENPLFASKGCKNVHQKVGYLLTNIEYV